MSIKFKQMLFELTEQLSFINLELDDSIAKSQKSIEISIKAYTFTLHGHKVSLILLDYQLEIITSFFAKIDSGLDWNFCKEIAI